MSAVSRKRPGAVPNIAIETIVEPRQATPTASTITIGSADVSARASHIHGGTSPWVGSGQATGLRGGKDPHPDATFTSAVQSIQRTQQALANAVGDIATHPSFRDNLLEVSLSIGNNVISHGLGRSPRMIYICLIASTAPDGVWSWSRRTGDDDARTIVINTTFASSVSAIVRVE